MKMEVLMSCMHQKDDALIRQSRITTDVLMINQCDTEEYAEYPTEKGRARLFFTTMRGLTRSRNMAIEKAVGDICLLCDDDECFVEDYSEKILKAYEELPQADVIIFKMIGRRPSFEDRVMELRFPQTMKVSSWQISFRRESLLKSGVRFDELLGAGTGNGAEEELKFLLDCQRAGLRIYYVPAQIAAVAQTQSTWNQGFTEQFFVNRGATTRYILGAPLALLYGLYYVMKKRSEYAGQIAPGKALAATLRGMLENKIVKQARAKDK